MRGRAKRAADAIIAALSVQSARGAKRASGRAARSSEFAATPPTTASRVSASRAPGSGLETADERPHDRALVGRREIRAPRLELRLGEVADGVEQRRLEAREREVEPGNAGDGKAKRLGIALAREPVDLGAAWIAEPEQPRALVERLARGVVERRAEDLERRPVADREQQRVPPAREQARERRLVRVGRQVERRDVTRGDGRRGRAASPAPTRSPWRPRGRRAARRRDPGPASRRCGRRPRGRARRRRAPPE